MAIWLLFLLAVMSGTALLLKRTFKANSYMNAALLACAFLILANTQLLFNNISLKTALRSFYSAVCNLLSSSNHFILSLDIMVFFSALILILYNALKVYDPYIE